MSCHKQSAIRTSQQWNECHSNREKGYKIESIAMTQEQQADICTHVQYIEAEAIAMSWQAAANNKHREHILGIGGGSGRKEPSAQMSPSTQPCWTTPGPNTTSVSPLPVCATPAQHTNVSPTSSDTTAHVELTSCHHIADTTHRLVNTIIHWSTPRRSRKPAANTELTPHTDSSTPDTIALRPPDNDVSSKLTTVSPRDTLSRSHRHSLTTADTTVSTPITSVSPPPDTLSRPHRLPLTAPDNTVSTPYNSMSPPHDTDTSPTLSYSRPHHQMTLHHRLTTQRPNPAHTKHYHRQAYANLEPPSPLGASAQRWLPPHTSDTVPSPYNNGRPVSRPQQQPSQLMSHPLIPYTDNWCVRAPSPRTARTWRSATVGAAPPMRYFDATEWSRALLNSERVSPTDCICE